MEVSALWFYLYKLWCYDADVVSMAAVFHWDARDGRVREELRRLDAVGDL